MRPDSQSTTGLSVQSSRMLSGPLPGRESDLAGRRLPWRSLQLRASNPTGGLPFVISRL
jgi:hypothetical protein